VSRNKYFLIFLIGIGFVSFLSFFVFQTNIAEFDINMVDYGYNSDGFAPTLTVKAGQEVKITLRNIGDHDHEFLVVEDKEESLKLLKDVIDELDLTDLSEEEKMMEYEERIEEIEDTILAFGIHQHEMEPGVERVLEFVIEIPGTYWYTCLLVDGTWPESHQEKGMVGQLIVE
jgi:uncharacterized cupredoxin-like copper-binding protein